MEACCFTGHRVLPGGERYYEVRRLIETAIREAYAEGCRRFFAGGALGFDMLAASVVCALRDSEFPDMTLTLILPCRDQDKSWSAREKEAYAHIKERAYSVRYMSEHYTPDCMHARNRALVDGSDLCLSYLTANRGGTLYTCAYALKHGVRLINLADELPPL